MIIVIFNFVSFDQFSLKGFENIYFGRYVSVFMNVLYFDIKIFDIFMNISEDV